MMKPSTQYGSHDSMAATASTVMQMFLFLSSHTAITHSSWCVGWQWSSMGATQTIINIVTKALLQMKKKKKKNVRAQTRVFVTTSIHPLNTCNRDDKTLESNDLYTLLFVFPSNMEKKKRCVMIITLAVIIQWRLRFIQIGGAATNGLLWPLIHLCLVKTSQEFKAAKANLQL